MLDKIITGLFVGVLGTLWFFTRRCELPQPYRLVIYDKLGRQANLDLRTIFHTHTAAVSFAKHYRVLFPQYDFVLESGIPHLRRKFLVHQK
ncbi:MAG: hypothetical protein FJ354_01060 [Thaumarchaeota archaeon]|nr:hypothetical protein [Nitrososphaerota archaeon]